MIRIGTSGFTFPDWVGTAYPAGLKKTEMFLYYVNDFKFDTVELNFTYYAMPSQKTCLGLLTKAGKDFSFAVKANRGMTHDPFDPRLKKKPSVRAAAETAAKFAEGLQPFKDAGQLGCVLLQFPVFFTPSPQNADFILQCKYIMKGIPLVVEFRHKSWAQAETFDFLRSNNLGYCAVDEPNLDRLMPFIPEVTSDIGYLRFHGRNTNWFSAPLEVRYDYLYKEEELRSFLPEIKKMSAKSKTIYVFFNNCHMGAAVRNSMELKQYIGEEKSL